jgi:hypothetical protein
LWSFALATKSIIILFFEMESAGVNIIQILGRQRKGFAYAGPNTIYPAALVFGIMGEAQLTAFAASDTLSAPLNLPRQDLAFL